MSTESTRRSSRSSSGSRSRSRSRSSRRLGDLLPRPAEKKRNPATRYDLQGLRGVGVIAVVIGHLYLAPQGVFSALDIFFVLSGFVITNVLLDMHAQHGRIYFVPFYLARARRLLPMGLFVTVVTIALGYLIFNPVRGDAIATDGLWSTAFLANWHFAIQGTDYFADQSQSPFLHYWSLSVEEQFYAVWPLLLFLTIFASRRLRSHRGALFTVVAAVAVGFFGYSLWHSVAAPTVAYFSTFDRAWQFAAGGLLSVARPELAKIPLRVARPLAWVGFWSLTIPIFGLTPGVAFPAPWGLLPVLCTAAVVAAGIGHHTRHLVVVDNRVMKYVGDISYSIYLWHLPVIIYLKPFFDSPRMYEAAVFATTAVLSVVFFHLVEKPMRFALFLMTPPERKRARRRPRSSQRSKDRKRLAVGWGAVAVSLALMTALVAGGLREAPIQQQANDTGDAQTEAGVVGSEAQRQADLARALQDASFPALVPSLKDLATARGRAGVESCSSAPVMETEECYLGSGPADGPLAVLVGDSVAATYAAGVLESLPEGWRLLQLTMEQCSAWTLETYVRLDGRPFAECDAAKAGRLEVIREHRPELVILASAAAHVRNAEREDVDFTRREVAEVGLRATIEAYAPLAGRLVVLQPRPSTPNLVDCVTRVGSPEDCVGSPSGGWRVHSEGELRAAADLGVDYIATQDWFCVEQRCPGWVGSTPMTTDGTHLTYQASRALGPLLNEAMFPLDSPVD